MRMTFVIPGVALAFAAVAAVTGTPAGADSGVTRELRGYGNVTASIAPTRSEFVCESEAKADILLGKLLADLFWDADTAHTEKTVGITSGTAKTIKVLLHVYPPYGALIAGRNKNRVLVVGGKDEREVLDRAKTERLLVAADTVFTPAKPYPKYLDCYDLRAVNCYTMGVHPENKYRYKERSEFITKFFKGGMCFSAAAFSHTMGEGVFPGFSLMDTDMALAEKEDQMYSISLSTGAWPDWAKNKWPDYIDRQSPLCLFPRDSLDFYPETFGLTPEQRRQTSLKLMRDVMLRYKDSPSMGLWQLYCGDYYYETYFHKGKQAHFGHTPIGLEGFRRWLRDVRGYSLKELGERWHGDENRFKEWSDVPLADPYEFFGNLDSGCFPIADQWFWRKAEANELERPVDDAPGWVPVKMPPSAMQLALPAAPAFWRSSFDPGTWLEANPGKDVYLVCAIHNSGWKEYEVWLNGKLLGKFKSKANPYEGPFAVKATGLLGNGTNSLVLSVPGGTIAGPVFLTTTMPQAYPYLGKQRNAQYVDILEWGLHELNFKVADAARYARSIDPDKPFVICATSSEVKDGQGDILSRYGGSMQDTGYESSYRQFDSRLGYAGGFYGSCEASGLPNSSANCIENSTNPDAGVWTGSLSRMINWTLLNGEGCHMFWRDPYCFFAIEKKTGWFTKHARDIELVGKYLPEKPGVAILLSSRSALLDPYEGHSVWEWDIGRGELHAAHYDNVYVTETMLGKGMADEYPILFDTDTRIMGREMIDALRAYVEKGGTFVALHNSGRHGVLEADAWPISELTGFKVATVGKKGKIRFADTLPLFKGWEGKEFEGEGSALDWKDNEAAKEVSVGLEPLAGDAVALAKWEDGSVAVGMRKLGKGNVILLGSTFWRYGRDVGGTGIWKTQELERTFFERLFTDLGVRRSANASDKGVFARKMVTKNGLQEWLVVMDQVGSGMTADVGFAAAEKPAEVWDMAARTPVAFDYADGWVSIKGVKMAPWEARIFGAKRGTMAEGVEFWWREKTKFWSRTEAVKPFVETAVDTAGASAPITFPTWKFLADKDNAIADGAQWLQPSFNDGEWRSIGGEAWNFTFEDLKDYAGVGLYRSPAFGIPSGWDGKKLTLNVNGYIRHFGYSFKSAEFYVNGMKVEGLPRSFRQVDITDKLRKEGNVLCVKVVGKDPAGDFPLSGLLDCTVWIEPDIQLKEVVSLAGEWQAVRAGWGSAQAVALPGKATGHPFVREVDIPAAWRGKSVFARLRNPPSVRPPACGMGNGMLMVNGQPVIPFSYQHKNFAAEDTVNLTPHIKYGGKNQIELWPQFNQRDPGKEYEFTIEAIEIGCGAE